MGNNIGALEHPLDSGRAISQDQLFSLPLRNGYMRYAHPRTAKYPDDGYYTLLQSSQDPLMSSFTSSPCSSPAYGRLQSPKAMPGATNGSAGNRSVSGSVEGKRDMNGSMGGSKTLDGSFRGSGSLNGSSAGSRTLQGSVKGVNCSPGNRSSLNESSDLSTLEEDLVGYNDMSFSAASSAPSTPHNMIRQKPPPKPPRMRNFTETSSGQTDIGHTSSTSKSSVSSLADVTSSLDAVTMASHSLNSSLSTPSPDVSVTPKSPRMSRGAHSVARDKVYSVLAQTKEFLSHEIEPEYVLEYLRRKGIISHKTEQEIRRCRTRYGMSEFLLDIITSKGQEEFMTFCDALRTMGKQGYVADFLQVLDSLVELVTSNGKSSIRFIRAPARNGESSMHGNGVAPVESPGCPMCIASQHSPFTDDIFGESTTFDIDISYIDVDTGQTKLFKDVQSLKRLRRPHSLSLDGSTVTIREEADRYIPVISVSLYNQCLCNNKINTLASLLENYSCVKELSISKNHIGTEGMIRIGKALERNKGLVKLDIRLNTIGDEGALYLAKGLKRHLSLLVLNVSSTGLTGTGCGLLMQGLGKTQSLIELDIGFNELDETGCQAVADALSNNCTLRKLRMRDNGVRSYGAKCIFRALKKNSRLNLLDISSNRVGNESIQALGDTLRFNRTLRELNLEKCDISTEGCRALSRALKTNTTLRSLDLSLNPVGDSGVEALAYGLKYNQIMDVLCLNMCQIANKGFICLLDAMRFNSTMTSLKLCYNSIGLSESGCGGNNGACPVEELYEKLCEVLQLNKDLKVLLWGNKFDEAPTLVEQLPCELDPLMASTPDVIRQNGSARTPNSYTMPVPPPVPARRQSTF